MLNTFQTIINPELNQMCPSCVQYLQVLILTIVLLYLFAIVVYYLLSHSCLFFFVLFSKTVIINIVCLFGFYVTPTQYRSFGDVQALLVEEDLRCRSVHYFRYKQAPEENQGRSVS
jgi:hypothetical protein